MSSSPNNALDTARRARALELARSFAKGGGKKRTDVINTKKRSRRTSPQFSEISEYQNLAFQRAAADHLGINNPFFRTHDGRAGPTTKINGREYINFASYDYLGLNSHPALQKAACEAIDRYGISPGASRIVSGERPAHQELEKAIAELYGVEDSIVFVSGHATNVSVISSLLGKDDLLIHDSLIHNSIIMGALLSGCARRVFRHNDYSGLDLDLETIAHDYNRIIIAVEGVYSMDGDAVDLNELVKIKERHGCWLMVDEAHAVGVIGATGRGTAEHLSCPTDAVDIWMGTLSKTFAGCGGYIAGSRPLVELLKYSASGFVYSVGLPPLIACSAKAAIGCMLNEPERVLRGQKNGQTFLKAAADAGLNTGVSQGYAVVPVILGDSLKAARISGQLFDRGINVSPIIAPAVPERAARLRFFITSEHTSDQIQDTIKTVVEELEKVEQAL